MVGMNGVVRLGVPQKERASAVLTKAFMDDPMYSYIFPDSYEREESLGRLWQALVNYTMVYGEIYTTPEVAGVACWLSPGNTRQTFWRMLRTGMGFARAVMKFEAEGRKRFLEIINYADQEHERLMPQPHWYLWAIGVEPENQGQGIGGRLIEPVLKRSAEAGLPCYLETQTEANVAFYQKRGFKVLSAGEVPGHGVVAWTMARALETQSN
jgi:ribosomal protein S18 acetylase RimI-like enzyme